MNNLNKIILSLCVVGNVWSSSGQESLENRGGRLPVSSGRSLSWTDEIGTAIRQLGHLVTQVQPVFVPSISSVYLLTKGSGNLPWSSDWSLVESGSYGHARRLQNEAMWCFRKWMMVTEARVVQCCHMSTRDNRWDMLYELNHLNLDTSFLEQKGWLAPFVSGFYMIGLKGWDARQPTRFKTVLNHEYIEMASVTLRRILGDVGIEDRASDFSVYSTLDQYRCAEAPGEPKDCVHLVAHMLGIELAPRHLMRLAQECQREVFELGCETLIIRSWGSYLSVFLFLADGVAQ